MACRMRREDQVTLPLAWRLIRRALALIGLPALIAVGLLTYNETSVAPQLQSNQRLVSHTLEVIATARALDLAVGDAESAQRGFVITGDSAYLDTYKKNTQLIAERLARFRKLTFDNPEQERRLTLLDSAIEGKLSEMQASIVSRQTVGFIEARRLLQSHLGADTRKVISGLIELAIDTEDTLLAQRQARLAVFESRSVTTDMASIGLVGVLLLLGIFLLYRAVSRERRSVAQLRESEERLRLIVNGVRDYAIVMLDPYGNVASWNTGAQRIKGYAANEVMGHNFSIFYPAHDCDAGLPDTHLANAAAEGALETEGWRLRKDGSRIYANTLLTALYHHDGSLRGFAEITRDVTDRRAQARALEESRAALAQSQKMESLGQLTGGLAHDFNNLLTVIIGSIQLILRKSDDPRKTRDRLLAAKQAAEQGTALIRRLLAFSRRQTLAPQVVDANQLVGDMSELLRSTLGESIALDTIMAAGVWHMLVDPNQLESALINLAANARDSMPEGGTLTIQTGNTYLDEEYAAVHSEVTPGRYVVIAVGDTGTGMPEQTATRAFEPFFTTKPEGRGTGLGLSQVHGFVKQSGGHVSLDSEPGHGTTVRMYLPYHESPAPAERAPVAKLDPIAVAARDETVLLVEDEPLVRLYGSEALSELGYNVLEASEGDEALRVLAEHPEVSLLFTDVGLPGRFNGRRLAAEARARMPSLKVLFVTGYAKNAITHDDILEGGVELLEKPYTVDALARKLKQMMAA
jgi:PAS domain S-box-containing protein